jgi:hypothetical protein
VRIGVLLLVGLVLAGCAERWQKPGATEAEFRTMEAQCTAHANDRWPPMLRQEMMMPPRYVPPVRRCDARGNCTWYGGWWEPPVMTVVDDHDRPRRQERRACYMGNGWMPAED